MTFSEIIQVLACKASKYMLIVLADSTNESKLLKEQEILGGPQGPEDFFSFLFSPLPPPVNNFCLHNLLTDTTLPSRFLSFHICF